MSEDELRGQIAQLQQDKQTLQNQQRQLQTDKQTLQQQLQAQNVTVQDAQARMNEPLFANFAQVHQQHMNDVQRQLELQNTVASVHTFDGLSEKFFKKWMKDLERVWLHHKNDQMMRCVIFQTVKDLAADYWSDVTAKSPHITWDDAKKGFLTRFSPYVNADIAKEKLKGIKQHKNEELYAFANRIGDLAKDAYDATIREKEPCNRANSH